MKLYSFLARSAKKRILIDFFFEKYIEFLINNQLQAYSMSVKTSLQTWGWGLIDHMYF
jgi:hypothetical protein